MKTIHLFVLVGAVCLVVGACQPQQVAIDAAYTELPPNAVLDEWTGKKVWFRAELCQVEAQHLIRPSLSGNNAYLCLQPHTRYHTLSQLLAYTADNQTLRTQLAGKQFVVFGVLDVAQGAGKGGGTHREYYLELDGVNKTAN